MPKHLIFLWGTLLVLLSPFCQRGAEAVSSTAERNRVILAYNDATDRCKGITDNSHPETVANANWECEKAFEALDGIKLNDCHGWRNGACRKFEGIPHRLCSCHVTVCDHEGVHSHQPKTFRDCSSSLWIEELENMAPPAPSTTFQNVRRIFNQNALHLWRTRSKRGGNASSADTQHGAAQGAGTSYGAATTQGAGTSYGAATTQGTGTSYGASTSYGGGSAAGTPYVPSISYGPGTSYVPGPQFGPSTSLTSGSYRGPNNSQDAGPSRVPRNPPSAGCSNEPPLKSPRLTGSYGGGSPLSVGSSRSPFAPGFGRTASGGSSNQAAAADQQFNPGLGRSLSALSSNQAGEPPTSQGVSSSDPAPDPLLTFESGGRFQCATCSKKYSTSSTLRNHEKMHLGQTRCEQCNIDFTIKRNLTKHNRRRHKELAAAEEEKERLRYIAENPFVCETCFKRYKSERGLDEHSAVHRGETTCGVCGKEFSRKQQLTTHKKTHQMK